LRGRDWLVPTLARQLTHHAFGVAESMKVLSRK
jgi:hypothetical protein